MSQRRKTAQFVSAIYRYINEINRTLLCGTCVFARLSLCIAPYNSRELEANQCYYQAFGDLCHTFGYLQFMFILKYFTSGLYKTLVRATENLGYL
jgi:hypothetical protein